MRIVEEFAVTPAHANGRTGIPIETGENVHDPIVCDDRLNAPIGVATVRRSTVFIIHDAFLGNERRDSGVKFNHSGVGGNWMLKGELEIISNTGTEGVGLL